MTNKIFVLAIITALGIGGASTIAFQSHAEQSNQPTVQVGSQTSDLTALLSSSTAALSQAPTTQADGETNNDQAGVDKLEVNGQTEKVDQETSDGQNASVSQNTDKSEANEGSTVDKTETEDAN